MEKLYEASIHGNVTSLRNLLHEDPLVIHKYISKPYHTETPLHIATLLGHVDFVEEILARKPDLAREPDSEGSTALHLAAGIGHVDIVRCLVKTDGSTCTALDRYGMNPVHVAAVKGRVNGLKEMMRVRPDATRMVTGDGLTILHLCVKYNQFEALKFIVEVCGVDDEWVNFKDQDDRKILVNEHKHKHHISPLNNINESCIQETLWQHGHQPAATGQSSYSNSGRGNSTTEVLLERLIKDQKEQQGENRRNAILIAATVIASMSFQAAANPPGGEWQATPQTSYVVFVVTNTTAFCCSALVFIMLLSRLPFLVNNYVIGAFNVALWLAILSSMVSFTCLVDVASERDGPYLLATIVWYLVIATSGILFTGHIGLFIWKRVQMCYARSQSSARPDY